MAKMKIVIDPVIREFTGGTTDFGVVYLDGIELGIVSGDSTEDITVSANRLVQESWGFWGGQ